MTHDEPAPPPAAPDPEEARAARLYEAGLSDPSGASPAHAVPTAQELAAAFPELEILELLGAGGMGVVYKARQRRLDRLVALKLLPRELGDDPAFAERFGREARTLARLDHPHIVRLHEFGEQAGLYYLAMEYVDGASLRQVMEAGGLKAAEALAIVPQICDALQYAHDEGVVHRDVKPENILLDERGRVKIADFGLAKLTEAKPRDPTLTGTRQVMGTWQYMAPEQYRTPQAVDHRADIYSLGVVFYEMLTGDLPVGRYQQPSESPDVDARIDEIVMRTLEREREQRYQRAAEVGEDVEHLQDGEAPAATERKPAPARRTARPGRIALLFGGIAVPLGLVATATTYLFVRNGLDQTMQDATVAAAVLGTLVWASGLILSIAGGERAARHGAASTVWIVAGLLAALNALAIPLGWTWAGDKVRSWNSRAYFRRHRVDPPPELREPTELETLLAGSPVPVVIGASKAEEKEELIIDVLEAWNSWTDDARDGDLRPTDSIRHYGTEAWKRLEDVDAEEVARLGAAGKYGLPMIAAKVLGAAPHHFRIDRIQLGPYERTATVRAIKRYAPFDRSVTFGMRRAFIGWEFTTDAVVIR